MVRQKKRSPAPRMSAATGLGRSVRLAANFNQDLTTDHLVVEHLKRRLNVSAVLAADIAHLAGLGPREVRNV